MPREQRVFFLNRPRVASPRQGMGAGVENTTRISSKGVLRVSIHLAAKPGDIAPTVLLPGDPLRARAIAETLFENAECYNEVRGMYGYTGLYNGRRVSVQGTGMGMPSLSIYVNELITSYGAKNLIRVGTCGSLQPDVHLRDVVLAMSACSNSNLNRMRFRGLDFAPTADFGLFRRALAAAERMGVSLKAGAVLSSDSFYDDDPEIWKLWASYGVLAVEMETAELYTLAAKHGVNALAVLTVSDSLVTHELTSAEERQRSFMTMVEIALQAAE